MLDTKRLLCAATLTAAALAAQTTTYVAPAGYATLPGHGGNAIPFWSGSGVYQQVHDAADLVQVFPLPVALIKAISFRKPNGNSTNAARTVDAQITIGATTAVNAQTASTTFANNLGGSPVVVLPYTNISLPTVSQVGNPNPQSWFFPFATPFTYLIATGNLCWELRLKNLSLTGGSCDSMDGGNAHLDPVFGTGCVATGQVNPAAIGSRSLALATGTYNNQLIRGAASAGAVIAIGATAQQISVPGMCAPLETLPIVTFSGMTDAAGAWSHSIVLGNMYWAPRFTLYAQFAFLDAALPFGFGVSNCSPCPLAPNSIARIWYGPYNSGQGNENALTGSRETYAYGLIAGFDI